MKNFIISTLLLALVAFVATSCDSLWKVADTTSVTFSVDVDSIRKMKQVNISGVREVNNDDIGTLTIALYDDDTKLEITRNIEIFTDDDEIASITFEKLAIIGKNVYATVHLVEDGKVFTGTSEVKRMSKDENVLQVKLTEVDEDDSTAPELEKVEIPTFFPPDGSVLIEGTEITLTSTTEEVSIYYTNGTSEFSVNSWTIYDEDTKPLVAFGAKGSITYRAVAVKEGGFNSDIVTVTYIQSKSYYVSTDSIASDATGDGSEEKPYETVQKAVECIMVRANGVDDKTQYFINIKGIITEEGIEAVGADGDGDGEPDDGMVEIESATELHITLQGWGGSSETNKIDAGASFSVDTISGSVTIDPVGIEKRVLFISGADVHVTLGSNLTLTGGTEFSNILSTYGGGVYVKDANFTINDGSISNNICNTTTIASDAPTSMSYGGGIYVAGGNVTMNNGIISNNVAFSSVMNSASFGGGVYIADGSFLMNNGTISDNASYSFFTYYFTDGGGVSLKSGNFTMNNGKITNNFLYGAYIEGGGVYIGNGSSGDYEFIMRGGEISSNGAIGRSASGGGIYGRSLSSILLEGGSIINNFIGGLSSNPSFGGGIYMNTSSYLNVKGDVVIAGNLNMGEETSYDVSTGVPENLTLEYNSVDNAPNIYLSDSLTSNASIGITISQTKGSVDELKSLFDSMVDGVAISGGDPLDPSKTYPISATDLSKISFDDKFNESTYLKFEIEGNNVMYRAVQP